MQYPNSFSDISALLRSYLSPFFSHATVLRAFISSAEIDISLKHPNNNRHRCMKAPEFGLGLALVAVQSKSSLLSNHQKMASKLSSFEGTKPEPLNSQKRRVFVLKP
jgi:hypothetical protein